MAEFRRNSRENYLEIFEGFHRGFFKNEYERFPVQDTKIDFIKDRKKIQGLRINDFFEKNEIASNFAEVEFAKLLNYKKYFYLYLGPKYEMHEDSKNFSLNINLDKPDFLINIPGIGQVFSDVKCRRLLGSSKKDREELRLFPVMKDELENLFRIEQGTGTAIWLVFIDYNKFNFKNKSFKDAEFRVIPLKVVLEFIKKIKKYLKNDFNLIYSFKLPLELFSEKHPFDDIILKSKVSNDLIKRVAEQMKDSLFELAIVIKKVIKNGQYYKTYLPYNLFDSEVLKETGSKMKDYFTPQDINSVLWDLIEKGEIIHNKGEYLTVRKDQD